MRDFYGTVAQVLPVLLLAFVWDSRYLEGLHTQRRATRREDPVRGVRLWTKPRVRVYALFLATVVLVDIALCVLMLADVLPDSVVLRGVVIFGMVMAAASLLFRIWVDVLAATATRDPGHESAGTTPPVGSGSAPPTGSAPASVAAPATASVPSAQGTDYRPEGQ